MLHALNGHSFYSMDALGRWAVDAAEPMAACCSTPAASQQRARHRPLAWIHVRWPWERSKDAQPEPSSEWQDESARQSSSMHFLYGSSGGIGGGHTGAGMTFGSGKSAIEQQLMLQLQACIKDNPDFTKELEAMEASAGGEASRRPWLSVQQLGQAWLQPSEATPDPQPKLSFLQYEQERYRQQQMRHQDTSREGSEDSYSDEYAAALSTALQAWEAESRSFGRRLGHDARQGFLVLGCKHTGGSWAPAAVRAARQRLDRRLGRVPAAWLEQAQQARGGTADNLGALQWRLPWALV